MRGFPRFRAVYSSKCVTLCRHPLQQLITRPLRAGHGQAMRPRHRVPFFPPFFTSSPHPHPHHPFVQNLPPTNAGFTRHYTSVRTETCSPHCSRCPSRARFLLSFDWPKRWPLPVPFRCSDHPTRRRSCPTIQRSCFPTDSRTHSSASLSCS